MERLAARPALPLAAGWDSGRPAVHVWSFEAGELRELATVGGGPSPGYPNPDEWLGQMRAWSRHNLAFGAAPGLLRAGTPTGTLVEIDVDGQRAAQYDTLAGPR